MTLVGVPITEEVVRGRAAYKKKDQITPADLAKVAKESQVVYEVLAQEAMEKEAKECDRSVMTTVLIYNASGYTLNLKDQKEWRGGFWTTPPDAKIANGQWATFLHTKTNVGNVGSCGCVVYRISEPSQKEVFFGWQNPWNRSWNSQCFGEVMLKDHYWNKISENAMWTMIDGDTHKVSNRTGNGFNVISTIGNYARGRAVYVISQEDV